MYLPHQHRLFVVRCSLLVVAFVRKMAQKLGGGTGGTGGAHHHWRSRIPVAFA